MKSVTTLGGLLVAGSAILLGQFSADAVPGGKGGDGGAAGSIGPDVIVGALPDIAKFGMVGGYTAYAVATTSCNIGDEWLAWYANTNQHPVIPQNMYRIKDGKIMQIGQSWLKHGFCALQQNLCGTCQPAGSGCPSNLGVGCSDPYSSSLNGQQSNLGPRSQVNAFTGYYPYPWSAPPAPGTIGRRLVVLTDDLKPNLNIGATYYCEAMYVQSQDAAAGNGWNNASYRKFNVGTLTSTGYTLSTTGPTYQQKPAINAWAAEFNDVEIDVVADAEGGLFHAGARAIDNGDGTWTYYYAVFNLNSDFSGAGFSVPASGTISNEGFYAVAYHSGEPYSSAPWEITVGSSDVTWYVGSTYAEDPNANALRWGTMYNFWFTSDAAPGEGEVTLATFKNGGAVTYSTIVPSGPPPVPGDLNGDGFVNGADLAILLGCWGEVTDSTCVPSDLNQDGLVNGADLATLLSDWTGG